MDVSYEDQTLVTNFMKKDSINNIDIVNASIMLELLEWQPTIPGFR